jgi:HSP20 family protein
MNTPTYLTKRQQGSAERVQQRAVVAPLVDVYENREELELFADVPGATADSIKVQLDQGQLTIEAKRSEEGSLGDALGTEWRSTDYYRVFTVSDEIDATKIDAKLSAGVLRVRLPKSEAVKPRRIAVKAE